MCPAASSRVLLWRLSSDSSREDEREGYKLSDPHVHPHAVTFHFSCPRIYMYVCVYSGLYSVLVWPFYPAVARSQVSGRKVSATVPWLWDRAYAILVALLVVFCVPGIEGLMRE